MKPSSTTLAIHAGRDNHGLGHVPSIDLSTTWRLPDPAAATDSIDALAAGEARAENPIYSRLYSPTVDGFERAMAALEDTDAAIAFASGMAAITALFLAAVPSEGEILAVRPVYGGTDHLLGSAILGRTVKWVRPTEIEGAISAKTALIFVETPANPTLDLVDLAAVIEAAGDIPVAVDATFATPLRLQPLRLGATYSVHSATKFLGGHGDVIAGVISCAEPHAKAIRQVRIATGGVVHPLAGYLLHRGLQTLPVRLDRAEQTATELTRRLAEHPCVSRVRHPSLPECDPDGIVGTQLSGPGALLAFEVDDANMARTVMARLRLITPAVSLGSVDTLIQHPASLTHRIVSEEGKTAGGISPGLLRLSVGLEDIEDLWRDLDAALISTRYSAAAK